MLATEQSVPVFLPEEEMGMQDLTCLTGSEEQWPPKNTCVDQGTAAWLLLPLGK